MTSIVNVVTLVSMVRNMYATFVGRALLGSIKLLSMNSYRRCGQEVSQVEEISVFE